MRRVKATQVQSHQPLYVDLDACPLIVRGTLKEQIEGRPERVLECTWLFLADGLREAVNETPEELFALESAGQRLVERFPDAMWAMPNSPRRKLEDDLSPPTTGGAVAQQSLFAGRDPVVSGVLVDPPLSGHFDYWRDVDGDEDADVSALFDDVTGTPV